MTLPMPDDARSAIAHVAKALDQDKPDWYNTLLRKCGMHLEGLVVSDADACVTFNIYGGYFGGLKPLKNIVDPVEVLLATCCFPEDDDVYREAWLEEVRERMS